MKTELDRRNMKGMRKAGKQDQISKFSQMTKFLKAEGINQFFNRKS